MQPRRERSLAHGMIKHFGAQPVDGRLVRARIRHMRSEGIAHCVGQYPPLATLPNRTFGLQIVRINKGGEQHPREESEIGARLWPLENSPPREHRCRRLSGKR